MNALTDLPLPALLLRDSALDNNIQRMAEWCAHNRFLLAPHGKTSMCPQIFARQLRAGAWAMTVATVPQALVCLEAQIQRVLIANQVVGPVTIQTLAAALNQYENAEIFCLVDSPQSVEHLAANLAQSGARRSLGVLIEIGKPGWRAGIRSLAAGFETLRAIANHPAVLQFRGCEAFEGLAKNLREAETFLANTANTAQRIVAESSVSQPIFSAGGSTYLGPVQRVFQSLPSEWQCVLRSGCYVTHDHGIYARKQAAALTADPRLPRFEPALELWAHVQSLPDPGRAILAFGKRHCAYDIELPIPLDHPGATITSINDQHAYLSYPETASLFVGSTVRLGISHPCTAFDKWRTIPLIDDAGNILDVYRTFC